VGNALAMEKEGRAQVILQGPDLEQRLVEAAARLLGDPDRLEALSRPESNLAVAICLDDLAARMEIGLH
jgi:hypothetical protein